MILEGTTSSGAVVPVQVTDQGKVVAEGLQGPQGSEGPQGPEGPPGPAGGYWERTGTVVSPTNAGDDLVLGTIGSAAGTKGVGIYSAGAGQIDIFNNVRVPGTTAFTVNSAPDASTIKGVVARINTDGSADFDGVLTVGQTAVSLDPGSTGSPLVRDSAGRLLVGRTTPASAENFAGWRGLHLSGATGNEAIIHQRFSADGGGPQFFLCKSRGSAVDDFTAVQSGNSLGQIFWVGANGTTMGGPSAGITAEAEENITPTSAAGRLSFRTTPSGSTAPVERMTIDSQGDVTFQGDPIIKSPDGKHWAIQVDNNGTLGAYLVI